MDYYTFFTKVWALCLLAAVSGSVRSPIVTRVRRSNEELESPKLNATTRQLGFGLFPPAFPITPYGLVYPDPYQYQPYGGYPPALTPFEPYPGGLGIAPPAVFQQPAFGVPGSNNFYPGTGGSPFGPYSPNAVYGASPQQGTLSNYPPNVASSYPTDAFSPSYVGTSPSAGSYSPTGSTYYNPSSGSGSFYPGMASVGASMNPYKPTTAAALIPDPFGSSAPAIGSPSYKPPQITIVDSASYNPSLYSPSSGSNAYKPGNGDGYDSVVINAQGFDQPNKPFVSGGYLPQNSHNRPPSSSGSSYRPPSSTYSQQGGYRPSIQGSIQEIPNTSYYTSSSQNRPTFYSASADQVLFPRE